MNAAQLAAIERQKNKPKKTGNKCEQCNAELTDVNLFFDKKTCGTCQPIHLLHRDKNKWDKDYNDLPF